MWFFTPFGSWLTPEVALESYMLTPPSHSEIRLHYVVFEHFWLLAHASCGGFPEGSPRGTLSGALGIGI